MNTIPTYVCNIYAGLKQGYDGEILSIEIVRSVLQDYCDRYGFAFTLTPTEFIYTDGNEPGCIVGIINYPRFPSTPEKLKEVALEITRILLKELHQHRISVVCSDETIMLQSGTTL